MLFHSFEFLLGFLPVCLLGIWFFLNVACRPRYAAAWLCACSLFFYGWWKPDFMPVLLLSIAFNFLMAGYIAARVRQGRGARLATGAGVAANLLLLGYFKYALFAVDAFNEMTGSDYTLHAIILPIGISFFTFKQIAYLVDAGRGAPVDRDPLTYALFITFFPHLIAGPILHHRDIMPQFKDPARFSVTADNLAIGLSIFIVGLFKKVVLADNLALYATPVFAAASSGSTLAFAEAWTGALSYTFQLYFDFSGYSDMALGLARMMGIHIAINFFSPYKSASIIEFWQRWHMTLSRFLRDYLYIPLGGNRRGALRRHTNLMITMLLGGLWHGAGWTFIVWGALHGAYLVINHAWRLARYALPRPAGWALTFLAVVVAWVVFRADNLQAALHMYAGMAGMNGFVTAGENADAGLFNQSWLPHVQKSMAGACAWIISAGIIAWCLPNSAQWFRPVLDTVPAGFPAATTAWRMDWPHAGMIAVLGVCALLSLTRVSEFLYFQF